MHNLRVPYYTVGKKIFPRAEEAHREHAQSGGALVFHPGLGFLADGDWQTEPKGSIQEIYRQRAQQIRDKYSRVVLFYSGGTDSHTILKTFVDNKIPIDKIKISVNEKWSRLRNWEHKSLVRPALLEYLHEEQYDVEVEWIILPANLRSHANSREEYVAGSFPGILPNSFRSAMEADNYKLRSEKGNTCIIVGLEKPTISVYGGYWCWQGLDKNLGKQETNFTNPYASVEEFFLSDDFPQIQIKLAWLKVKYLEQVTPLTMDLREAAKVPFSSFMVEQNLNLIRAQAASSPYYMGCNKAMGYSAIHPWLDTGDSKAHVPTEFWINDLARAFQQEEGLLRIYEGELKDAIKGLPDYCLSEDQVAQRVIPEMKTLAGIWTMPIPIKPFIGENYELERD